MAKRKQRPKAGPAQKPEVRRDADGHFLPGFAGPNPTGAGGEKGGRPAMTYRAFLGKAEMPALARLIRGLNSKNESVAVTCAREILDRIHGKAPQPIEGSAVNILVSDEWAALRGAILDALAAFPDAKLAIAQKLGALAEGAGDGSGG
jgi:hypothetical protein